MAIKAKWASAPCWDDVERCMCCDREVSGECRYVCVIEGGSSVASSKEEIDENDAGYMGYFAVGPTCAKKHFAGAYFV